MNALKFIADKQSFVNLKGYDQLTEEQKETLMFLSGEISNGVGEFFNKE